MVNNKKDPRVPQTASLDRRWLQSLSRAELVELLVEVTLELRNRLGDEPRTEQVSSLHTPTFPAIDVANIRHFARLPESSQGPSIWRIVLVSSNTDYPPLGLDICDDATFGRNTDDISVDLDLTPYDAFKLGVSREHSILRPGDSSLMLFDLGSANGTFCNGVRARLGHPLDVHNGDVIAFGAAHFKVLVVSHA